MESQIPWKTCVGTLNWWLSSSFLACQTLKQSVEKERLKKDNFTWDIEPTNIKNKTHKETEQSNFDPNLTKHQKKNGKMKYSNNYKRIKEPLPPAPRSNLKVDNDWNEMKTHNCRKGKDELERVYKPFTTEELSE